MNISRRYGLPEGRSLVWLRTTIRAAAKGEKRAAIGWNDEVWVFVNGRQVYADVNEYLKPELRKRPDGRLSLENGAFTLPLDAGDNDVVVGVANAFFGWGLMLRLDDPAGVTLTHIHPMSERADPVGLLPRSGVGRAALLAVLWTVIGVIFALPNIGTAGSAPARAGLSRSRSGGRGG